MGRSGPTGVPRDHQAFYAARAIILRVHERIGLPCQYRRGDFRADQKLIEERSAAMRRRQREEAARIAMFEAWRHGEKLDEQVRCPA
jgi:hypothetical protein